MPYTLHELDPKGDVFLIVQNTYAAFAVWDETHSSSLPLDPEVRSRLGLATAYASTEVLESAIEYEPECEVEYELEPELPAPCKLDDEVAPPLPSVSPPLVDEEIDIPVIEPESTEVYMRVSSRHLTLASPYFAQMLKEDSREADSFYADGSQCLTLDDCDPDTLLILMNIIHGLTRKVPRSVSLETLSKVAVLVDRYACAEVVVLLSEMWIGRLENSIPKTLSRDLILWIYTSHVFCNAKIFKEVTTTALKQSRGRIQSLGLPIPERIVDMIDQQRQELINQTIAALTNLLAVLRGCDSPCSFECSSILLGALTKEMHKRNFISPSSELHLLGFNCLDIAESIRNFQSPAWESQRGYSRSRHNHGCSLQSRTEPIVVSLEDGIVGFSLVI